MINKYKTIKEAIIYSSEPFGLFSFYIEKNGKEVMFINGKPSYLKSEKNK